MPLPEVSLQVYQPSDNAIMNDALGNIETSLQRAAAANVAEVAANLTEAEIRAVTVIEELRMLSGMDLATVLLRGKLIKQIEEEALFSIHPDEEMRTMEGMARKTGISLTEYSNVKHLVFTIFPFLEAHGVSVQQTWEEVGKSNLNELLPILVSLISGQQSISTQIRDAVANARNDVTTTATASGLTLTPDEITSQAVSNILAHGASMSNRELRRTVRQTRTTNLSPVVIKNNNDRIFIVKATPDQYLMLQRALSAHMDEIEFDITSDRTVLGQIPILRELRA